MQSFQDGKNRRWTLDLNGHSLRRVFKLTGVNLSEMEDGTPPLVIRLQTNVVLQVDVICALLLPDIEAAGLSDEEFGKGLSPETVKVGVTALQLELLDFFRRLGRPDQVEILKSQAEFGAKLTTRKLQRLERLDVDALLNKTMPLPPEQNPPESPPAGDAPSGNDTTNTPPSSGATPINTP